MNPTDQRPLVRITDPILGTFSFWGASPLEVVLDGCVVASCTTPAATEAARRLLTSPSPKAPRSTCHCPFGELYPCIGVRLGDGCKSVSTPSRKHQP